MKKLILLIFAISALFSKAQNNKPAFPKPAPKLIVGIVVDQMRYDFIYRYWNKYGNDGFKRLIAEGYLCRNTHYNYVPTYTAPGHASVFTGTTPAVHGIVGNNWYSREKGKMMYCTEDASVQTVGSNSVAGKMSPRNMLSTTIGDELKLAGMKKPKVIGIALKDRAAILPAGHTANAAYWLDKTTGAWISSTYYMKELPKWVADLNAKEPVKAYLSKPWTTLLPIEQYTESLADDNKYESKWVGETAPVFPHNLPELMKANGGMGMIVATPFGNSLTKDMAIEAIKAENLGKGEVTDMLTVSFSSTDHVGHFYGVSAIETEDTYLRLDKDLGELLKFLDTQIGKANVLVFLTADHGAVETPAYLMDSKVPGGYINDNAYADTLKRRLFRTNGDSLIIAYTNNQFYLNHKIGDKRKINMLGVERTIADYMLTVKGVAVTVTGTALKNNQFTDGVQALLQNGYHQSRSGDVVVAYSPGWIDYEKTGTSHGTPYRYDTHVPLIWYGYSIKPGSTDEHINITDIAPTVTMMLNIPFPGGSTGKVIRQISEQ